MTSPVQSFRPMSSHALARTPSKPRPFICLGQCPHTSLPEHLQRTSLVQSCKQAPSHALPVWSFKPTPSHALARTPSHDLQLYFLCFLRLRASAQESICTSPNCSLPKQLAFLARMNTCRLCWNDIFRHSNALLIWRLAHQLGCQLTKLTHHSIQLALCCFSPWSGRPCVGLPPHINSPILLTLSHFSGSLLRHMLAHLLCLFTSSHCAGMPQLTSYS